LKCEYIKLILKLNKENVIKKKIIFKIEKKKLNLMKGMRFAIREGGRTVGAGIVLSIIK
jgi:translation elongation factor EF-Tu-like GTPase